MSNDNDVKILEWDEHIRLRPGMYVGKHGDGSDADDGLYVLLKEVIDNSIDEYRFGYGKEIVINLEGNRLTVRDYGRGIDFDRLTNFKQSLMNSNDKESLPNKSVGLTGVGFLTVIALSSEATIISYQKELMKRVTTSRGKIVSIEETQSTNEHDGLSLSFIPDNQIFEHYKIRVNYIRNMLKDYAACNPGIMLRFDNDTFYAPDGMLSLVNDLSGNADSHGAIHIVDDLCDIAIVPANNPGEGLIQSFVNGHPTIMGGTHVRTLVDVIYAGLKKHISHKILKCDIPADLTMCINITIKDPQFESCTKTRLASRDMNEGGKSIKQYVSELIDANLQKQFDFNPVAKRAVIQMFNQINSLSYNNV